jgi:hypothetical protein
MPFTNDLLPPPGCGVFEDLATLKQHLSSWGADHGFDICWDGYSKGNVAGEITKWQFACARSGRFKGSTQNKRRNTSSQKCECPFKGISSVKDGVYTYRIIKPDHNHSPTGKPSDLAINRQLTAADLAIVRYHGIANIKSANKTLQHLLQAFPESRATRDDDGLWPPGNTPPGLCVAILP